MIWIQDLTSANGMAVAMAAATVFLLSIVAVAGSWLLRKRPAFRHTFLLAALLGCLASPLVAAIVVASGEPVLKLHWLDDPNATRPPANIDSTTMATASIVDVEPKPFELAEHVATIPVDSPDTDRVAAIQTKPTAAVVTAPKFPSRSWVVYAAAIWLLGSLLCFTATVRRLIRVRKVIRLGRPLNSDKIMTIADTAARHVGLAKKPALLESTQIRSPAVVGYRRMSVLLPCDLFSIADEDEMCNVLVHEFAHVRRRDPIIALIQSLARCLFWPIFTIHWLDRELSRAREEVCDNYVLARTTSLKYGQTLLKLGRMSIGATPLPASVGILNWKGELEQRIAGFLDSGRSGETSTPRSRAFVLASVVMSIAVLCCGTRLVEATGDEQDETKTANTETDDDKNSLQGKVIERFESTIEDAQGNPVSGVKVELWQLAYGGGSRSPEKSFQKPYTTSDDGKISIAYPKFADRAETLATSRLGIRASHPDFPSWSDYLPIDHAGAIRLPNAVWATVAANFPNGAPIASDLYAVTGGLPPRSTMIGPTLRIGPMDLNGRNPSNMLRVIHAPDNGAVYISDLIDLSQLDRDDNEINMTVSLSPSATVRGQLSEDVPRPIKNGSVTANIIHLAGGQWRWLSKTAIAADGTFAITGMPHDEHLQLIATCDGWISLPPKPSEVEEYSKLFNYDVRNNHGSGTGRVTPQLHYVADGVSETTIQMHPAGTAKIKVVDWQDKPVAGVSVIFNPNQAFHNGGSQGLGEGMSNTEMLPLLRLTEEQRRKQYDKLRTNVRTYQATTDQQGEAVVADLPAHKSWHAIDGEDSPGGQFIGFRVQKEGYRLVPKEPQRIFSFGGSPQETIDMIAGDVATMRVRMERTDKKPELIDTKAMKAAAKAKTPAAPKVASKPADKKKADAEVETTPITVRGVCKDINGNPVADADIELISVNGIDRRLGKTKSDANGRYAFKDVAMPVRRSDNFIDGGTINLFATADSLGLAWHGKRSVLLVPRPAYAPIDDQTTSFYEGESIFMNLEFLPEARFHGRIVDTDGNPVPNATIQLSGLDYLDTDGKVYHHNYREFWGFGYANKKYRLTKSDADGNFAITGLPQDSVVRARISHDNFANQAMYVAITDREMDEYTYASNSTTGIKNGKQFSSPLFETRKVQTCPLKIEVASNRSISIDVVDGDGKPVPGVQVSATSGGRATGTSAYGKTDAKGVIQLELPPGEYRLTARPSRQSTFVTTYDKLKIEEQGSAETHQIQLVSGCVLILKAIDADTGDPIKGMSFWCDVEGKRGSRTGLNSSPMYVDHPVSDENGVLQVVMKPGKRKLGVGWSNVPAPYQGGGGGRDVECVEGKTLALTFEVRKQK